MNPKWYSVSDMVNIAVDKYSLSTVSTTYKNNYYVEFSRGLKDLNMWDNAHTEIRGKSITRVFSETQMQKLFSSRRIHDFISKNSDSENIRNRKSYDDYMNASKSRRDAYIDYLDNQGQEDNLDYPQLTREEFTNTKTAIMIEAIFNYFYTDFNDDLLESDLNTILTMDELNLTLDVIHAEERLSHPYGNYYSKKSEKQHP